MKALHKLSDGRRRSHERVKQAFEKTRTATTRLRFEQLEDRRLLTVVISGNGNTDAASLKAYVDPSNQGLSVPAFANVGGNSTNGASVVYLGNRWVITAAHVNTDSNVGPVRLGGNLYAIDNSSITILHNPDNSLADLKLVRLTTDPGLPAIDLSKITTASPASNSQVIMIGNGLSTGTEHFWNVDKTGAHWVWTDTGIQPSIANSNQYGGFDIVGGHVIRWGDNKIFSPSVNLQTSVDAQNNPEYTIGFTTKFDTFPYTYSTAQPYEAHASMGDSGGAVFSLVGGQWKLAGIMTAITDDRLMDSQPAGTELFGQQTLMADLSLYRSQISAIAFPPSVAQRSLFYAHSSYDGFSGTGNAHDQAIAPKVALLPGAGLSTFNSVSSYGAGINGIMIDVTAGGNHSALVTNAKTDFTFKVSGPFASNSPGTWTTLSGANLPTVTLRTGAGVSGSDRVELTWPDGKIMDTWLEVVVKANADSGLAADDVFYFGSLPGDSGQGDDPGAAFVDATDEIADRVHQNSDLTLSSTYAAAVANPYDVNKDNQVDATDQIYARNFAVSNPELDMINIPLAGPFAPSANLVGGEAAVAAALSLTSGRQSQRVEEPVPTSSGLVTSDSMSGQTTGYSNLDGQLETPASRAVLSETNRFEETLGLDDEFIDSLLVGSAVD